MSNLLERLRLYHHYPGNAMKDKTPRIIHVDDDIIVVDKPSGMPSVSLKKGEEGTLASLLVEKFPEQVNTGGGELEAGLVHRLDNDTSGVIIAARNEKSYESLRSQFSSGDEVKKEYITLVLGKTPEKKTITTAIAHHPRKKKKMVACESAARERELKGRKAVTELSTIAHYFMRDVSQVTYSLVLVTIGSGVRHQIRVHLASEGFPIAGDLLYQNPKKRAEDISGAGRLLLHSFRVSIVHPATKKKISFKAPLPDDFASIIRKMRRLALSPSINSGRSEVA